VALNFVLLSCTCCLILVILQIVICVIVFLFLQLTRCREPLGRVRQVAVGFAVYTT